MSPSKNPETKKQKKSTIIKPDEFLVNLVKAPSPSGFEFAVQAVIDEHMKGVSDEYRKDTMGNRMATIHPKGKIHLMLAGHMDEIGFIVTQVNKEGFIFIDAIGGHDVSLVSGRRVKILTKNGPLIGITGRRAIHLLDAEERKQIPKLHKIWVDIGVKSKEEALEKVSIGDGIIYDQDPIELGENLFCARALDDKAGTYAVLEVLRRLAKEKKNLEACVTSVATVQEEIGVRGAIPSTYNVKPDVGIAVDVCHATDFPDGDQARNGEYKLGAGPAITRGANINPKVFERLIQCADKEKIPYQVMAEPGVTGTDARVIQISRAGVAAGLVSIPLRYMHTPNELAHLEDIENTVKLLVAFARSLKSSDNFTW